MACNCDTSATLSHKRKRTLVSYAEVDQLADLLSDGGDDVPDQPNESSDDESNNDDRTYSRRKKSPKKSQKKKAKLTTRPGPQDKGNFRFLDLPPELRDMIYEMALTDIDGISIVAKNKAYRRAVTRGPICPDGDRHAHPRYCNCSHNAETKEAALKQAPIVPNLLAVNKQIHREAINILYEQNFIFEDTAALHRFLANIGTRNSRRLLSIDIKAFCTSKYSRTVNHCAFALLAPATNLKVLQIPKEDWRWRSSAKRLAQNVYRDMHFFLEAYGAANGRRDAAIDIIEMDEQVFDHVDDWRPRSVHAERQTLEKIQGLFYTELRRLLGVR